MFISNLYFWLSNVLSLLISIDQETVLDFLGIEIPFNEDYSYLFGDSIVSTPISSETFQLITQSIWDHYQHGLGFVDIENVAIFILVIRFIFLSKKYNIKTGFFYYLYWVSGSLFMVYAFKRFSVFLCTHFMDVSSNS